MSLFLDGNTLHRISVYLYLQIMCIFVQCGNRLIEQSCKSLSHSVVTIRYLIYSMGLVFVVFPSNSFIQD